MPTSTQQEQDIALRLQYAEQRRANDQYIRQDTPHSPFLADDAAVLLNTILDQTEASTTRIAAV